MFDKDKSIFFDGLSKAEVHPEPVISTRELQNRNFKPQWPIGHKMDYGLRLELYLDEKIHEIKYELQVVRIKNTIENFTCFTINRISPVYINENEPDLLADQLAYKVGGIFYPMNVVLDAEGKVAEIQNLDDVQHRWKKVKEDIQHTFEGAVLDEYVERMEKNINDPFILNLAIKDQDWFLNAFFLPVYKNYNLNDQPRSSLYFPILPFRNVNYSSSFVLDPQYNDSGMIEINVKGEIDPLEIDNCLGNYSGKYLLHPHNKQIWILKSMYTFEASASQKYAKLDVFCIRENDEELDFNFDHATKKIKGSTLLVEDNGAKKRSIWKDIFR
ncbi:hypothetical protein [Pedobacter miscanthi]|uniref:hypothetical protein n=1 Tax=Pedobacter miscanthi TaxID=2259170 RepID=UPI00292DF362|nr:hypothetical protein [Pedobacter miscanthi]